MRYANSNQYEITRRERCPNQNQSGSQLLQNLWKPEVLRQSPSGTGWNPIYYKTDRKHELLRNRSKPKYYETDRSPNCYETGRNPNSYKRDRNPIFCGRFSPLLDYFSSFDCFWERALFIIKIFIFLLYLYCFRLQSFYSTEYDFLPTVDLNGTRKL